MTALLDEEKAFYIRNGISVGALEDMRKSFYLDNISNPDSSKTNDDLEVEWLKEESGITDTSSAEDIWRLWLVPTYGSKAVEDLKLLYYQNN